MIVSARSKGAFFVFWPAAPQPINTALTSWEHARFRRSRDERPQRARCNQKEKHREDRERERENTDYCCRYHERLKTSREDRHVPTVGFRRCSQKDSSGRDASNPAQRRRQTTTMLFVCKIGCCLYPVSRLGRPREKKLQFRRLSEPRGPFLSSAYLCVPRADTARARSLCRPRLNVD